MATRRDFILVSIVYLLTMYAKLLQLYVTKSRHFKLTALSGQQLHQEQTTAQLYVHKTLISSICVAYYIVV